MKCLRITMLIITLGASIVLAEDIQINLHVSQDQKDVDLAFNGSGQGVAVWNSYQQDGSSGGIFAQRLDQTGQFLGDEFQVNDLTEGNQAEPGVAMGPNGRFLACWRGPNPLADHDDVFARLFDPNGIPLTDDVLINDFMDNDQGNPRVAGSDTGYVVVWESKDLLGDGNRQICARLIDPFGQPVGPEIRISDADTDCRNADIALDREDRFVVAWLEGKSSYHIKARTFDPNGVAEGPSFRVDTVLPRSVTSPSVAIDALGGYLIVWDGDPNRAADDNIHLRQYDPNNLPLGDQVTLNTTQLGAQRNPRVAINQTGIGLVAWEHESGSDANAIDVVGQYLDAAGNPLGPEMRLNTHTAGSQQDPAVCIFGSGQALVAWESDDQDGSGRGVFASISPPCITADLAEDAIVNFLDFCVLAEDDPAVPANILDPNSLASLCEQWVLKTEPEGDGE